MKIRKIYGSPGTGKTATLMALFENALKSGCPPDKIAFLTFTRAARDEVVKRAGKYAAELPWLRTIHSACFKAVGVSKNQIMTSAAIRQFGRTVGVELSGVVRDPWFDDVTGEREWRKTLEGDQVLQLWHLARHLGYELIHVLPPTIQTRLALSMIEKYEAWKFDEGMLDYTDLLTEFVRYGKAPEIVEAFVDEAQDLSWLQWQVMKKLVSNAHRLTIAGDDDQTIFTWAGARADYLNELKADLVEILPRSYRLPRRVLKLSEDVIGRVRKRTHKVLEARNADGEIVKVAGELSKKHLGNQTMILFRNNHRALKFAARLDELGVAFTGTGSALDEPAVKLALSGWLSLSRGETVNSETARRLIEASNSDWLMPRARESVKLKASTQLTWEALFLRRPDEKSWVDALTRFPMKTSALIKTFRNNGESLERMMKPTVRLLSIHRSKGSEAETVILDPTLARRSYDQLRSFNADDEHRVWYVGITRARQTLVLLTSDESYFYEF